MTVFVRNKKVNRDFKVLEKYSAGIELFGFGGRPAFCYRCTGSLYSLFATGRRVAGGIGKTGRPFLHSQQSRPRSRSSNIGSTPGRSGLHSAAL